jgi:hypothetical protein
LSSDLVAMWALVRGAMAAMAMWGLSSIFQALAGKKSTFSSPWS